MPLFKITVTEEPKLVWTSPDGTRKIHDIVFDIEGASDPGRAQTFSDVIATKGWSGEVEVYEKNNNQYVRQAPKQSGYSGGGGGGRGAPADPHTMYVSYAKDLAIASVGQNQAGLNFFNKDMFNDLVESVANAGNTLMASKTGQPQPSAALPPAKAEELKKLDAESDQTTDDPFEGMDVIPKEKK